MTESRYHYYILKNQWLARLEKGPSNLAPKEFYKNGKWVKDDKLNLMLNDCMMDYGDCRWYEYDDVTEEEAFAFIEQLKQQQL